MATKTCVIFFTAAIFTYRLLFFTLHCLQFCVQGASENKENDNYFASARWIPRAIPHNSKCRYGERGAADAKPKAQIILCVLSSILATQMPCRSCRSGA
ncbi:MAG: hypothetical protein SPI66_01640, partial [Gemmiger qucibialis]|nr:hypothetical protein [Gemmiger qucibialis]